MSHPVQMKVFGGMMLLTKRTYLLLSLAGFVTLLAVWAVLTFVFVPGTFLHAAVTDLMPWFYDALPWVCLAGVVLELIEVAIVLRRFRQRERFLARERGIDSASETVGPETAM